ncbi:MAG: transcriptional repressor [Polyangiaceae bacterium]
MKKIAAANSKSKSARSRGVPARSSAVASSSGTLELQQMLRAAGLRSTAPRVAVLRHLTDVDRPLSHAQIFDALGSAGFDRATLYRNLMDLAETGLIGRTDLGDHVWRFEIRKQVAGHTIEHPHFVCTDCGTVACLTDTSVRIARGNTSPRSLAGRDVAVQIRAICDACA